MSMKTSGLYLRTIIFGVIDSLVSTVGLLAGIDVAGAPHKTIALTGIVYAFVEAFSMAVGNFLSEESVEEYEAKGEVGSRNAFMAGTLMFVIFVIAAFVPIFPYLIWTDATAPVGSVILSVVTLFIVGVISGKLARLPMMSRGLRMALLGGAAIVIGMIVGYIVPAA